MAAMRGRALFADVTNVSQDRGGFAVPLDVWVDDEMAEDGESKKTAMAVAAAKQSERVKVIVRCRPMNRTDEIDGREILNIIDMDSRDGLCRARKPLSPDVHDFTFDAVYDVNTIQGKFYDDTGYSIVENVMDGYNGTIFAYGQTGTGKTYTMSGPDKDNVNYEDPELAGVIPRTFAHIFGNISTTPNKKFLVRASYLEIYNEEIHDLLSKTPKARLELQEKKGSGVAVSGLSTETVKGASDLNQVMQRGQANRSTAATRMNNHSSRSHAIFTITIETAEKNSKDDKEHIRVGKMNLVDLAGSERQSKSGSSGDTLKEASQINSSLSTLGNVISALVDAKPFVPYRNSKLTRLLKDSLGGSAKTVICVCIGPADRNYDETLATLRFADRAKRIKNKPRINEDPNDATIREFQEEIARLKQTLASKGGGDDGVQTFFEETNFGLAAEMDTLKEKVAKADSEKQATSELLAMKDDRVKDLELQLAAERMQLAAERNVIEELQALHSKDLEFYGGMRRQVQESKVALAARLKEEAKARSDLAKELEDVQHRLLKAESGMAAEPAGRDSLREQLEDQRKDLPDAGDRAVQSCRQDACSWTPTRAPSSAPPAAKPFPSPTPAKAAPASASSAAKPCASPTPTKAAPASSSAARPAPGAVPAKAAQAPATSAAKPVPVPAPVATASPAVAAPAAETAEEGDGKRLLATQPPGPPAPATEAAYATQAPASAAVQEAPAAAALPASGTTETPVVEDAATKESVTALPAAKATEPPLVEAAATEAVTAVLVTAAPVSKTSTAAAASGTPYTTRTVQEQVGGASAANSSAATAMTPNGAMAPALISSSTAAAASGTSYTTRTVQLQAGDAAASNTSRARALMPNGATAPALISTSKVVAATVKPVQQLSAIPAIAMQPATPATLTSTQVLGVSTTTISGANTINTSSGAPRLPPPSDTSTAEGVPSTSVPSTGDKPRFELMDKSGCLLIRANNRDKYAERSSQKRNGQCAASGASHQGGSGSGYSAPPGGSGSSYGASHGGSRSGHGGSSGAAPRQSGWQQQQEAPTTYTGATSSAAATAKSQQADPWQNKDPWQQSNPWQSTAQKTPVLLSSSASQSRPAWAAAESDHGRRGIEAPPKEESSFDGTWIDQKTGVTQCHIAGNLLTWAGMDVLPELLKATIVLRSNHITLPATKDSTAGQGSLDTWSGKITWEDGDIWGRQPNKSSGMPSSDRPAVAFSGTGCDKDWWEGTSSGSGDVAAATASVARGVSESREEAHSRPEVAATNSDSRGVIEAASVGAGSAGPAAAAPAHASGAAASAEVPGDAAGVSYQDCYKGRPDVRDGSPPRIPGARRSKRARSRRAKASTSRWERPARRALGQRSLSQFAGELIYMPTNPGERIFKVIVLFSAIIVSALFICTFTTSMTQLQSITSQQAVAPKAWPSQSGASELSAMGAATGKSAAQGAWPGQADVLQSAMMGAATGEAKASPPGGPGKALGGPPAKQARTCLTDVLHTLPVLWVVMHFNK